MNTKGVMMRKRRRKGKGKGGRKGGEKSVISIYHAEAEQKKVGRENSDDNYHD